MPVVVLEPSCASVFRDEMVNLLPDVQDACRLQGQTFLLSEFLQGKAPQFQVPKLARKALVHGHCHHKSLMKMDAEVALLKKMGLDYDLPETGCCGMAGAFGFERDHYDVSIKCGERVLLPAVRNASKDTLVITDGFSCHEQIQQTTDRRPLHLAQVIDMALHQADQPAPKDYPERAFELKSGRRSCWPWMAAAAAAIGAGVWWMIRRRSRS